MKRILFVTLLACSLVTVADVGTSEAGILRGVGKAVVGAARVVRHPFSRAKRSQSRARRACARG